MFRARITALPRAIRKSARSVTSRPFFSCSSSSSQLARSRPPCRGIASTVAEFTRSPYSSGSSASPVSPFPIPSLAPSSSFFSSCSFSSFSSPTSHTHEAEFLTVREFRSRFNADTLKQRNPTGCPVAVRGWVRTVRAQKQMAFVVLSDGSTLTGLQVILSPELAKSHRISTGSSLAIRGNVAVNPNLKPNEECEVIATRVDLIGAATEEYPFQKKYNSLEFVREKLHFRFRTNFFGAVMRVRSTAAAAIHDFFQTSGFLQFHPPILTPLDCEGAGELFKVVPNSPSTSEPFFGVPVYLTVSGQLYAEMAACGMSKVYTFAPTFRAENSNTTRHLCEFWMIEPEVAFAGLSEIMQLAERCIKHVARRVLEQCAEDMDYFNSVVDSTLIQRLQAVLSTPFAHMTYSDAIKVSGGARRPIQYIGR